MTVQSELITFAVTTGFAGLALAVAFISSLIFALWQRRSTPTHLWIFQCAVIVMVCLLNVVDWQQGFIQRTQDGREVPWFRSVGTVLLFSSQAMIVAGSAHMSMGAASIITLMGMAAGGASAAADLIAWPESMWPLATAIVFLMVQVFVVVRKSPSTYFGGYFTAISTFVIQMLFLAAQFFSWAMLGQTHNREGSEIFYSIVYGVWIICSGLTCYVYTQYPADMQKRKPY